MNKNWLGTRFFFLEECTGASKFLVKKIMVWVILWWQTQSQEQDQSIQWFLAMKGMPAHATICDVLHPSSLKVFVNPVTTVVVMTYCELRCITCFFTHIPLDLKQLDFLRGWEGLQVDGRVQVLRAKFVGKDIIFCYYIWKKLAGFEAWKNIFSNTAFSLQAVPCLCPYTITTTAVSSKQSFF